MSILEEGIKKIYSEHLTEQRHYITTIYEGVRKRNLSILFDLEVFYVPNDEFMIEVFGPSIMNVSFDCYDYMGECKWKYHLVLPIRDVSGNVVGFSGYNPYVDLYNKSKKEPGNKELASTFNSSEMQVIATMPRYKESSSLLMDKSKFFICPLGFEKAMDDGYIILVDGFFDSISIAQEKFNSISILGSSLSEYVRFCLSFIKVVYVAHDNDSAGKKLYNSTKKIHPNVHSIVQSKCKDIDDFIKMYPNEFHEGMKQINTKIPISFMLEA